MLEREKICIAIYLLPEILKNSALFHLNRVVQTHTTSFPCCLRLMMWPLSAQGNTKDKGKEKREKKISTWQSSSFCRAWWCAQGGKKTKEKKKEEIRTTWQSFSFCRAWWCDRSGPWHNTNSQKSKAIAYCSASILIRYFTSLTQHKLSKVKCHSIFSYSAKPLHRGLFCFWEYADQEASIGQRCLSSCPEIDPSSAPVGV